MMGFGRGLGTCAHMLGGGWYGGGPLTLLFGVLVALLIALVVIWALRAARGHAAVTAQPTGARFGYTPAAPAAPTDEAIAVARRRYASGEITTEQYAEIIQALGG